MTPKIQLKHFFARKIIMLQISSFSSLDATGKRCIGKKKTPQPQLYSIHLATKKELESQNYCSKNKVWIFSITKFIKMPFVPKTANEKGLFELQLVGLFSKFLSKKKKTRLHLVFILHQILV